MIGISYIVSAYDRPHALASLLYALAVQTHKNFEILVTCNRAHPDNGMVEEHERLLRRLAPDFSTIPHAFLPMDTPTSYHAAERAVELALGEYLCFPSDDSYYVPIFGQTMLDAARRNLWDLVYCDMLYDGRIGGKYDVFRSEPLTGKIDKTCFILRRECFRPFPQKPDISAPSNSDGFLVEELVATGMRFGKVEEVLVVHN